MPADLQESKDAPIDLTKKRPKLAFYASYEINGPTVSPWKKCFYIKESRFNTKVQTEDETIVLSDSDDDDDCKFFFIAMRFIFSHGTTI